MYSSTTSTLPVSTASSHRLTSAFLLRHRPSPFPLGVTPRSSFASRRARNVAVRHVALGDSQAGSFTSYTEAMCLLVYIAADGPLPLIPWDERAPAFHVAEMSPTEPEVRPAFSKPSVYYLASHDLREAAALGDIEVYAKWAEDDIQEHQRAEVLRPGEMAQDKFWFEEDRLYVVPSTQVFVTPDGPE